MALKEVSLGQKVVFLGVASPTLTVGVNSLTWCQTFSNIPSLPSNARNIASGSIVLACVGNGALANVVAPTDNKGNTYSAVLPAHPYINWSGSGSRPYASIGVTGDSALVVSEAMSDHQDEVTLSLVEIKGGTSITHAAVADVPGGGPGPTTSPSVTVSGPAALVSWWWGDGAVVQDDVQPSSGWTLLHALNWADAATGVVQPACAARIVSAGTYSCTWTATGTHGGEDQGGFAFIVSVE